MKQRLAVAEKRARRVINLSVPRRQATGAHCELTGVWKSPAGASISLYEGQLFPSDSGRPCIWAYAGQPATKARARCPVGSSGAPPTVRAAKASGRQRISRSRPLAYEHRGQLRTFVRQGGGEKRKDKKENEGEEGAVTPGAVTEHPPAPGRAAPG